MLPGSPAFSTQISIVHGQNVRLSRVSTIGAMRVEARLPADSYALVLDLGSGLGLHRGERQDVIVNSECGFLHAPLELVEVTTPAEFDAIFLRFSRNRVVEELQNRLEREIGSELTFSSSFRVHNAAGDHLHELYESLLRNLCGNGSSRPRDSIVSHPAQPHARPVSTSAHAIENALISLLLEAQPHNYTRLLHRGNAAGAFQLRAAEEFMRANAHLPISLGDICTAAGVNARTLQYSFKRNRSCNPMQFLRNLRMEGVRRALLHPGENTSVSGEATHWGFLHFGRFSGEYRSTFGELPSETLRRSRNEPSAKKKTKLA